MIERMKDRCERFCGSTDSDCFANSKDQLSCLSDLIINKTGSISMLLGFTLETGVDESAEDSIRVAYTDMNELTNWIQYLVAVGDMRELDDLVLSSNMNKARSELRYPVPKAMEGSLCVSCESISPEPLRMLNYCKKR